MSYSADNPWIKEREATVCTWKADYNRGFISNMSVSLLTDFITFSDRQLAEYVKMMKACGFTGIQVTDICAAWRASGSWEFVHDRYKVLANELHKNGMKFTVWCWAAEFTGHGWHDEDVVYSSADGATPAYDDPRVFASFNKYYDIYADLAPYADRVIAHFFDPGNLSDMYSILKFTRLLADKFRALNPDVKVAIDTWGAPENYPEELVKAGMSDIMLMELPSGWGADGKRARFREGVKKLGCELGAWGWYTCEYEIDQMPLMFVNNRVLADVYRRVRDQGDHVMIPSYWSEMDSYHLLNFFSLYAAGHLLIDPERDPDELLYESAALIAGDESADTLCEILSLIRDARSGDTWNSYWWWENGYILKHGDYSEILPRAERCISLLKELIETDEPEGGITFPLKRRQLYRLMLPHLHQIRQFADFSVKFAAVCKKKNAGADPDELQKAVDALPFEVPEYNCVIGLWGQTEARVAYGKLTAFCRENGLNLSCSGTMKYVLKRRLYDFLCVLQRGIAGQNFHAPTFYEGGLALDKDLNMRLIDEMVAEGIIVRREDGRVALTNWENFRFDFNI